MANPMVKFIHGVQAQYDALRPLGYDADMIYFITDTKRIYKGDILMAEVNADPNVLFVTDVPVFETAKEKVVYVYTTDSEITMYIKGSTGMEVVGGGTIKDGAVSSMSMFGEELILKSSDISEIFSEDDDEHLPTAGAVAKAIKAELASYAGAAFTGVSAKRVEADELNKSAGTVLEFTCADGKSKQEVRVSDLFLTGAEYNSETHILALSVQGQDSPVEVDLAALIPEACSTSDVKLSDKIVATVAVGNIKKGQEIDVTDLQSFLVSMLSSDSMPSATAPSVSLSGTDEIKAYEVGTKLDKIEFTATLSKGSYTQTAKGDQVASGITNTKWELECTGQDKQTSETSDLSITGTFDGITVEDTTSITVKATATYTGGSETPLSYLGKTEVNGVQTSTKRIPGGSKNSSKGTITGFRNCFWGYKNSGNLIANPAGITVAEIKALGNAGTALPSSLEATGMQQMFFAVPKTLASKLSIKGANPPAPQTVVGPVEIQIGGVDNYSPIAYNLFYVSNASAASGSDTYALTWE